MQGCLQNGYDETSAEKIYDLIVRFANYGFNRSHAVAYSMIGYQLAYLKANYTLEFMTALLSSAIGNEDKIVQYINKRSEKVFMFAAVSSEKWLQFPNRRKCNTLQLTFHSKHRNGYSDSINRRTREKMFEDLFEFCLRMPSKFVTERNLEAFVWSGCLTISVFRERIYGKVLKER